MVLRLTTLCHWSDLSMDINLGSCVDFPLQAGSTATFGDVVNVSGFLAAAKVGSIWEYSCAVDTWWTRWGTFWVPYPLQSSLQKDKSWCGTVVFLKIIFYNKFRYSLAVINMLFNHPRYACYTAVIHITIHEIIERLIRSKFILQTFQQQWR